MRGTTFHFLAPLSVLLLFSPFFQNGITWQEIKGVSSTLSIWQRIFVMCALLSPLKLQEGSSKRHLLLHCEQTELSNEEEERKTKASERIEDSTQKGQQIAKKGGPLFQANHQCEAKTKQPHIIPPATIFLTQPKKVIISFATTKETNAEIVIIFFGIFIQYFFRYEFVVKKLPLKIPFYKAMGKIADS